jgi:DNA polymerase elongation subunit (family B)
VFSIPRIYAGDIETDNSEGHGLNPLLGRITEIAIQGHDAASTAVFSDDDEKELLRKFTWHMRTLEPGLVVTWNGSFFDLPFIQTRADILAAASPLQIEVDENLKPKYDLLPGYTGGVVGTFDSRRGRVPHQHLDISGAYKQFAADHGVSWSLKPVCAAAGIDMYEIDRTRLQDYTAAERERYVLSDTNGTLQLAYRLLGL